MNHDVGQRTGASIRRVREVDVGESGIRWGQFLRVKIDINLKKMMARGRTTSLLGNKT